MQVQVTEEAIERAAAQLLAAQSSGRPTAPVRTLIGDVDIDAAYRVQQRVISTRVERGAIVVGRKIGLTSEAVQHQVGVDRPDFGVLLDDMAFADGDLIPSDRLLQPRAEVEVAFVLAHDIDSELAPADLRDAVAVARPALEIVDSRVRDWDIVITDTVADNASSGAFVLGEAERGLDAFEPREATMTLTRNGETASTGLGTACLGDPLLALAWLARTAIEYGAPLRAGDIVLSGALGPLVPVGPGDRLEASIVPLGTVAAGFDQGGIR